MKGRFFLTLATLFVVGIVGQVLGRAAFDVTRTPDAGFDDSDIYLSANVSGSVTGLERGACYDVRCSAPFWFRVGEGSPTAVPGDNVGSGRATRTFCLTQGADAFAFLSNEATGCTVRRNLVARGPVDAGAAASTDGGSRWFTEGILGPGWEAHGYPVAPDGRPIDPHDSPLNFWGWGAQLEYADKASPVHVVQALPHAERAWDAGLPPAPVDGGLGWCRHARTFTVSIWVWEQTDADAAKAETFLDCFAMRGLDRAVNNDCGDRR